MTVVGTIAQRRRGRPRAFDVDTALDLSARLFAHDGYDRVTLADLNSAIGISPPSFYAAFGNKAALFIRVVDREKAEWLAAIDAAFAGSSGGASGTDKALASLLDYAAHRFVAPAGRRRGGGLLWEAVTNCEEISAVEHVRTTRLALATAIWRGVARSAPERAAALTDSAMAQLAGLSAMAREGMDIDRLLATARAMACAFPAAGA